MMFDKNIYVTGNLGKIGLIGSKQQTIRWVVDDIMQSDTVTFPTHSFSLVGTDIPFDLNITESESGILTEKLRTGNWHHRQFHPFASVSSIGEDAEYICENTSRHVYGEHSPMARMIEMDTTFVSIGLHPRLCCSNVHHAELVMGVPYRYTKEFIHPVVTKSGDVEKQKFYMFVTREGVERDKNRKIFEGFMKKVHCFKYNKGYVYMYSMREFHEHVTNLMRRDINIWLR